jgi:hypothetical protein
MRFTVAIAGPIPGMVAAAAETQLGRSYITYERYYAIPAREEGELAKISIGNEEPGEEPAESRTTRGQNEGVNRGSGRN